MCRDFIRSVRVGPKGFKITFLQQSDGKQIPLDDASDEQVLQIANEIADAIGVRRAQ